MEETAEAVIKKNGKKYTAQADLGVRWIPAKTYGDLYFPAGNYEALNVTLGKGEGQNWWCVLFPPLCLIEDNEEEIEAAGFTKEKQLEVKSKLMEILHKE